MKRVIVVAAALLALAGCAKSESTQKNLTERQRDSILAKEPIPGATGVGAALKASDNEAKRAADMNAQVDSLTR